MKNRLHKHVAFLLVLASLLTFSGCSSSGEAETAVQQAAGEQETAAETTPETSVLEALPVEDLGGMSFRMLGVSYPTRRNFPVEEETGEAVNDALVRRDLAVSEMLNVVIESQAEDKADSVTKIVKDTVIAGDAVCDMIISDIASSLMTLMTGGSLLDMRQMDNLSLAENWWSYGMYENASINGRQYITMGDISPMKYYAPYCLAYNQKLGADYGYSDLYEEVLNGTWTVDMFHTMLEDANKDLDGDGDIDKDDFHGYAHVDTTITAWSHYTGAGQMLSTTDADGKIVIPIGSDNSVTVIEKLRTILGYSPDFNAGNNDTMIMFMEDRALFFGNSYSNIIANFREMESDFSVIPTPKYNEDQEHYYSFINTWCLGGVGVPVTCQNPDATGLVMEALGRASYLEVRPALYETTIKSKVSRNAQNAQILDIIFDNTYIDCNGLFNIGGSADVVGQAILGDVEFASAYAAVQKKMDTAIEDLMKIGQ
ncbi:MAG: hypothetical protein IJB52_05805 [Clostridia bacterium]|nr:hypothetical protein [Clostridia bacterium]